MKDTLILPDQILKAADKLSHSPIDSSGSQLLPVIITAAAIITANVILVLYYRRAADRANRMTLHINWANEFRRNMAIFLKANSSSIEDLYKIYLASNPKFVELMKANMGSSYGQIVDNMSENHRNSRIEIAEAWFPLSLLFDRRDNLSNELYDLCRQIDEIKNYKNSHAEDAEGLLLWKKEMEAQYSELALAVVAKTIAYISEKEKNL
jgi:hypothetical protein